MQRGQWLFGKVTSMKVGNGWMMGSADLSLRSQEEVSVDNIKLIPGQKLSKSLQD